MIQRCFALPYYVYCLRLRCLVSFLFYSTIKVKSVCRRPEILEAVCKIIFRCLMQIRSVYRNVLLPVRQTGCGYSGGCGMPVFPICLDAGRFFRRPQTDGAVCKITVPVRPASRTLRERYAKSSAIRLPRRRSGRSGRCAAAACTGFAEPEGRRKCRCRYQRG
ncbi:Uncharacterised protein [Neisseria animalis]|nr:Uncharacterised protein [Neisseria animalis]